MCVCVLLSNRDARVHLGKVKMSQGSLSQFSALNLIFCKRGWQKGPPPVWIGLNNKNKKWNLFWPEIFNLSKNTRRSNYLNNSKIKHKFLLELSSLRNKQNMSTICGNYKESCKKKTCNLLTKLYKLKNKNLHNFVQLMVCLKQLLIVKIVLKT